MSSNETPLERVTRDVFSLGSDIDIIALSDQLASHSKSRRGSAELSQEMFMAFLRQFEIAALMEIGGNNGRHTRKFLEETNCHVHVFEPNPNAIPHFADLVDNNRVSLNFYGLSNVAQAMCFNIPKAIDGKSLSSVNGISSFGKIVRHEMEYDRVVAMAARADSYLDLAYADDDIESLALWIDVEGHSKQVFEGFGDYLSIADICICEIEYPSRKNPTGLFGDTTTADSAIKILEDAGHSIIYRDFQNIGQGNIISISSKWMAKANDILRPAKSFIDAVSSTATSS